MTAQRPFAFNLRWEGRRLRGLSSLGENYFALHPHLHNGFQLLIKKDPWETRTGQRSSELPQVPEKADGPLLLDLGSAV